MESYFSQTFRLKEKHEKNYISASMKKSTLITLKVTLLFK